MSGAANTEVKVGARWGTAEALIGWFAAQLVAVLWAGLLAGLRPGLATDQVRQSLWWFLAGGVGLWAAYGAVAVWLAVRDGGQIGSLLGSRPTPVQIGFGLVCGVACQLLLIPMVYQLIGDRLGGDPEAAARELISLVSGPAAVIGLVVAVVFIAPVAEEFMYRGVLLRGLETTVGSAGAIGLSSVVFAAAHGELILLPGLTAFAVVLGLLAHRFEGLAVPICAHMSFNATTVVLLLT